MTTQTDGCQYQEKIKKKGITFIKNPHGYIKAENEYKIYEYLKKYFTEKNWEYIEEYPLPVDDLRIDFMVKSYPDTFIEVKNDWARKRHLKQVIQYNEILKTCKDDFQTLFLCVGIDKERQKKLDKNGIKTILLKDLIL